MVSGWLEDDVPYLGSKLGAQRSDYVVEPGFLSCDTFGSKLCLHLSEPNFGVRGPSLRLTAETEAEAGEGSASSSAMSLTSGHQCSSELPTFINNNNYYKIQDRLDMELKRLNSERHEDECTHA